MISKSNLLHCMFFRFLINQMDLNCIHFRTSERELNRADQTVENSCTRLPAFDLLVHCCFVHCEWHDADCGGLLSSLGSCRRPSLQPVRTFGFQTFLALSDASLYFLIS